MTKQRVLIIAVIVLVILNLFLIGSKLMHKKRMGRDNRPKHIVIQKLGFDTSQIAEYESLISEHQSAVMNYDEQIQALKKELFATLNFETNSTREQQLAMNISTLQSEIQLLHLNHFKDVKAICTADQMDEFTSLTQDIQHLFRPQKRPHRKK